jgi:hypothetical protein
METVTTTQVAVVEVIGTVQMNLDQVELEAVAVAVVL